MFLLITSKIGGEESYFSICLCVFFLFNCCWLGIWRKLSVLWIITSYFDVSSKGFKLGSEKHTTEVTVKKSGAVRVDSGIEGLALLKTTQVRTLFNLLFDMHFPWFISFNISCLRKFYWYLYIAGNLPYTNRTTLITLWRGALRVYVEPLDLKA